MAGLMAKSTNSGWRIGKIVSVDDAAGTATITTGGAEITGVPWLASAYYPIAGDRVTIVWDRTAGLLIGGTLSTVQFPTGSQEVMVLDTYDTTGYWQYIQPKDRVDPWYLVTDNPQSVLSQGWTIFSGPWFPGDDVPWKYVMHLWDYGDIAARLPSGSKIDNLSFHITRTDGPIQDPYPIHPQQSTPILWGHNYTSSSPPPETGKPSFTKGPWKPGALNIGYDFRRGGESGTFPLPKEWQDDLLSGAMKGVALYAEDHLMAGAFQIDLVVSYRAPKES